MNKRFKLCLNGELLLEKVIEDTKYSCTELNFLFVRKNVYKSMSDI
ncbi:hypothetical protein HMPREF9530_04227 [Escherichia coli MS 21-1]|nr:hypothetical protein HMPREF9530_04227 [Escherichia coli MS 21-1]KDW35171.1 hypothetical protein AC15_0050 [Escherichia coli 2-156-04_S3_C2]